MMGRKYKMERRWQCKCKGKKVGNERILVLRSSAKETRKEEEHMAGNKPAKKFLVWVVLSVLHLKGLGKQESSISKDHPDDPR
jgi:hypothetical protein